MGEEITTLGGGYVAVIFRLLLYCATCGCGAMEVNPLLGEMGSISPIFTCGRMRLQKMSILRPAQLSLLKLGIALDGAAEDSYVRPISRGGGGGGGGVSWNFSHIL